MLFQLESRVGDKGREIGGNKGWGERVREGEREGDGERVRESAKERG